MERLAIEDAAVRLGVSVSTIRRRIRDGVLTAEREQTPQGFKYWVLIPGETAPPAAEVPAVSELALVREERDWLRARVEELTTLLNREQEVNLRLSTALSQRPVISPPANTPAPSQADQVPSAGPRQVRQERRRRPLWQVWVRRLLGE